jgi:hypothetical protein
VYVEHCEGTVKENPTTPAKCAQAQEWRAAVAVFKAEFHAAFPWRREGRRGSWDEYSRANQASAELKAARGLNSHKGRMRRLEAARLALSAS